MATLKDMYYTIAEAAKEFSVSRQTIYRWVEDNKIPMEKIGGIILVEKKAIQEYATKKMYESFRQMMYTHTLESLRQELGANKDDKITQAKPEKEYLVFLVSHKNGECEKIKIGGMDITISMGRKQTGPSVSNINFKELTRIECEPPKKRRARRKNK